MKSSMVLLALSFTGCANITPAQQANIDKAVAVGLDIAAQVAAQQLSTRGFAK